MGKKRKLLENKNNSKINQLLNVKSENGYSPFVVSEMFCQLYVTVTVCTRINHNTPVVALTYRK